MIENKIIGPVEVPEGVKIISTLYSEMYKSVLLPWLEYNPLYFPRKLFSCKMMHCSVGQDFRLMNWYAASADLNDIENLCAILKRTIYADGSQFHLKDELWRAIKTATAPISPQTIKIFTESEHDSWKCLKNGLIYL